MNQTLVCPEGHQWESVADQTRPSDCPSCGQAGTTVNSGAFSAVDTLRDELPPLPHSSTGSGLAFRKSPKIVLPDVDGFVLMDELGRGGMGVVYYARQIALDRIVALKMLLSGEYASEQERLRFQLEAQTLAQLHHPNIVQVYLTGNQAGRPYLCMELVSGPSLATVAAGSPIAVPIAARIVQEIAGAVHVAHEHDVIHRDLKPANVLLEGGSHLTRETRVEEQAWSSVVPKITDFGLAKRIDDACMTHSGAIIGTPSYMAPEQAEGKPADIGPRTDVYALGAILYELLTGRPPHVGSNAAETIRQIAGDDPVSPRVLQPSIPRDLETICLRCLERDPHRRYLTAEALSDDLRRFREGLPVLARPVTIVERWWKWSRRRPAVAALLGVSILAATALLVTWASFTIALKFERDEAQAARSRENEQRTVADENFRQAREAVDKFLIQISQDQLLQQPGLQTLRRELLASAQDYYEQFLRQRANDNDLQLETALTHCRLGLIQREFGSLPEALAAYQQALDIYESNWSEKHSSNVANRLASTYHDIALIHRMSGQLKDANIWYQRALTIDEQLVSELPEDLERKRGMAKTLSNLGVLAEATGARLEAVEWGKRACDILEMIATRTSLANDRLSWARGLINYSQSQSADASAELATLEQADCLLSDLATSYPEQQEYRIQGAKCLHNLGIALSRMDQRVAGRDAIRRAIELNRRLVNDNPQVQELRQQSATSMYVLAALELKAGEIPTAIQLSAESQRELQTLLEQSPENPAYLGLSGLVLHQSGELLVAAGESEKAIEKYELAAIQQEQALAIAPDATSYRQYLKSHRAAIKKLRDQKPIPTDDK